MGNLRAGHPDFAAVSFPETQKAPGKKPECLHENHNAGRMLLQQLFSLCAPAQSSRGMPFSTTRRAGRVQL